MNLAVAFVLLLMASVARAGESISFSAITETNRVLVSGVTEDPTLRRDYVVRQFQGRVTEFEWLLDHLDACSALAEKTGLLKYRATRQADGRYYADNREGAAGFILPVLAENGKRAYYVEGRARELFSVRGRGVAAIAYRQGETNTIEYTGAIFVKVDNVVWATLAEMFGAFLSGTVDYHYNHVMGHPIKLSERALTEPKVVVDLITQMPEGDRKLLEPFAAMLRGKD